jgi:hypothetical protein
VGVVSGSVLTVLSVNNGSIAVGLSVNRGDTGVSIGAVLPFGTGGSTGTGGVGTYVLTGGASIGNALVMSADNNSTLLVAADGGRWYLAVPQAANLTTSLIPAAPFTYNIGSPTYPWLNTYTQNLYVYGAVGANLTPDVNNFRSLGSPSIAWAQLYLGPANAPAYNTASGNIGYYGITAAETAASVTPSNYSYAPGDLRRYGATGGLFGSVPSTDDSAAWATAVSLGIAIIPAGWAFKIVSGATITGQMQLCGSGPTSQLYCDSAILTVISGNGSAIDNVWLGNITPPWLIQRNPANFGATITTLIKSSTAIGYQPTSNDPEYTSQAAAWNAAYGSSWSTQNIGPVLQFQGAASGIEISRIYGRFVRVNLQDAVQSSIHDCQFTGGKGVWSAITIDNCTNGVQRGYGNRAYNNVVTYASFCGITWFSNDDFTEYNNECDFCGESGLQTGQCGGVQFTSNVAGETSGTLTANWPYGTGTWYLGFNDGEIRTTTVTSVPTTTISWTGALTSGIIACAAVWGATGSPASIIDPRCYRGRIFGNTCSNNYFDGLDCLSIYPPIDATLSRHHIVDNYSYNNYGDGISVDGRLNSVNNNHIFNCGTFGIWGTCSDSLLDGNFVDNCNTRLISSVSAISALGLFAANKVSNSYINTSPSDNGTAIYAPQTAYGSNDLINNRVQGAALIFAGNPGQITGVYRGNVDTSTGLLSPQSFVVEIANNGGTLQHIFYSDASASGPGLYSKISGATSGGYTNTPTGTDASTAFAAGAKIGSAATNILWLNTNAQLSAASLLSAIVEFGNAADVLVQAVLESVDINGVTQNRLGLSFSLASTGALFALNTTNIAASHGIIVRFNGELA